MKARDPLGKKQKFRISTIDGCEVPPEIYGMIKTVRYNNAVTRIDDSADSRLYLVYLNEHIEGNVFCREDVSDETDEDENVDEPIRQFEVKREFFDTLLEKGHLKFYTDKELETFYFKPVVRASRLDSIDFED